MPLSSDVVLKALAERCQGYTGADIALLCREAAMAALSEHTAAQKRNAGNMASQKQEQKIQNNSAASSVTLHHFDKAFQRVRPSLVRGLSVEVAPLQWDDVGGLQVSLQQTLISFLISCICVARVRCHSLPDWPSNLSM